MLAFLDIIENYQTLIGSIITSGVAGITIYFIYKSAKLPIEAQERIKIERNDLKVKYTKKMISHYLGELSLNVSEVEKYFGTRSMLHPSDKERENLKLKVNKIFEKTELMMRISDEELNQVLNIIGAIDDYNLAVSKHSGSFSGKENEEIQRILKNIMDHSETLKYQIQ